MQQLLLSVSGDSPLLVDSVISVGKSRVAHPSCRKVTGKVKKRNTTKGSKSIDSEVVLNSDSTQCSDVGRCCVDAHNTDETVTNNSEITFQSQNIIASDTCSRSGISVNHCSTETTSSVGDTDTVVLSEYSDTERILVVDNIKHAFEFNSSQRILKEINVFCSKVKVDFAYSLAKGGVAIHTNSKEDKNLLLEVLPAESFIGGVKHPPLGQGDCTAYIKGVDTSVHVQKIAELFHNKGIEFSHIRRLTKDTLANRFRLSKLNVPRICLESYLLLNW